MYVPCGRCRSCRIARSREWYVRIMHELDYWESAIFATFTYRPEALPSDNAINKSCLQRLFKRIRKAVAPRKIRYFASGEYGEKFGRPHYHAIIFGLNAFDRAVLESAWPHGFVHIGSVTFDSARYVADYIQKDDRSSAYANRKAPFSLKSAGIGKQYALDHAEQIIENMSITVRGVEVGIPKYYQKVLNICEGEFQEKLREKAFERLEQLDEHYSVRHNLSDTEVYPAIVGARRQADRNVRARAAMREKGKL